MLRQFLLSGFLFLCTCVGATSAVAEVSWKDRYYNPAPQDDDFILPMPCQGALVFRKVSTPTLDGAIGDVPFILGEKNEEQPYLTGVRRAFVSGPFTAEDGQGGNHFFMGKYELAQIQFDVVMGLSTGQECPDRRINRKDFQPVVNVSKLQLLYFAELYTVWLLEHAPEMLPRSGNTMGFVRLPTEAEWEFSARGGTQVSEAVFRAPRPPVEEGAVIAEYIAYNGPESANGDIQAIGLRRANPLGLHDMLGNVSEIVDTPFSMVRHGRLHGQTGGFVKRGGNARSRLERVTSASRFEVPPYDELSNRVSTDRYTGARFVLSGQSITSPEQLEEIIIGLEELARPDASLMNAASEEQALAILDDMAATSFPGASRDQLDFLKSTILSGQAERNSQRDRAIRLNFTATSLLCDQVIQRYLNALSISPFVEELRGMGQSPEVLEELQFALDSIASLEQRAFDSSVEYANFLEVLASDYSPALLERQLRSLIDQVDDTGSRRAQCFLSVEKHLLNRLSNGFANTEQIATDFKNVAFDRAHAQ